LKKTLKLVNNLNDDEKIVQEAFECLACLSSFAKKLNSFTLMGNQHDLKIIIEWFIEYNPNFNEEVEENDNMDDDNCGWDNADENDE